MRFMIRAGLLGFFLCVSLFGTAHAQQTWEMQPAGPRVFVPHRHPGSAYGSLASGIGLTVYGLGTSVGTIILSQIHTGDDGAVEYLAYIGSWLMPVTLVTGLALTISGGVRAHAGLDGRDSDGEWMSRELVEQRRSSGKATLASGVVITSIATILTTVGFAKLGPTGMLVWTSSLPFLIVGSITLGVGAHVYTKYDYALSPSKYERSPARVALNTLQVLPMLSPQNIGLQLTGAF